MRVAPMLGHSYGYIKGFQQIRCKANEIYVPATSQLMESRNVSVPGREYTTTV